MKILVLGKGNTGSGINKFLNHMSIEHDFLNTNEIKNFNYDVVIKSPGISYQNEIIKKFKKSKIISDIEFIGGILNRDYIGVTGTNGKTTTVTLINNILSHKIKSIACGNIGFSFGEAALTNNSCFVCELSSFILAGVKKFHPKIAVILNMNRAHIDYHINEDEYYKAKCNMLSNQNESEYLVYNGDDETIKKYIHGKAKKISFGLKKDNDYYYDGKYLRNKNKRVMRIKKDHLIYNKMASIIVGLLYKIPRRIIRKEINKKINLSNRLEKLKKNIYNDAKSTNPSSTINALKQFKKNVILLCGGIDRGEDLNILKLELIKLKSVYAYGQTKI